MKSTFKNSEFEKPRAGAIRKNLLLLNHPVYQQDELEIWEDNQRNQFIFDEEISTVTFFTPLCEIEEKTCQEKVFAEYLDYKKIFTNENPASEAQESCSHSWQDGSGLPISANSTFQTQTSAIFDLQIYDNSLYICGNFFSIDGKQIGGIAKWNGASWCGVGQYGANGFQCMAVFNSELYVAGAFSDLDGIPLNYIAKWIGGSYNDTCSSTIGIVEPDLLDNFKIYPNPSDYSFINIDYQVKSKSSLCVTNAIGEKVIEMELFPSAKKIPVALTNLNPGVYIATFYTENSTQAKRFVIQ